MVCCVHHTENVRIIMAFRFSFDLCIIIINSSLLYGCPFLRLAPSDRPSFAFLPLHSIFYTPEIAPAICVQNNPTSSAMARIS